MPRNHKIFHPSFLINPLCMAFILIIMAVGGAGFMTPSHAQENLGEYGNWAGYRYVENGEKTCNLWSRPLKSEGKYTKRGDVFIYITRRESRNWQYDISLSMGYKLKENSEVSITIDKSKRFKLFTLGENAFSYDEHVGRMLSAMKSGLDLTVSGVSWRGTRTRDVFSLKGVTKGLSILASKCK